MSTIQLDSREQRRLLRAQEALLSPLADAQPRQWQVRANRAVRAYLGADHSVFAIPEGNGAKLPPMVSDDTDPSMPERLCEYIEGWSAPFYTATDPYLEMAIRRRLEGGAGAYHIDELLTPDQQRSSMAIQEVFVPAGMPAMMGLSLPLADGEATQFFGFESRNSAGFSERGLRKLRLLLPAFVAGVRSVRRWHDRAHALAATLDVLDHPVALYSVDGVLLHRNRTLRALLLEEAEAERVTEAVEALVEAFVDGRSPPQPGRREIPVRIEDRVSTRRASYGIWASLTRADPVGRGRILIQVEREGPTLPAPEELVERHGLSARQAEVALLLARGYSDKAVARRLDVSWHTARTHARNVLEKLELSSRAEVAVALLGPPPGEG